MQDIDALLDTKALGRRIGKTATAIYTMRCRGDGPPAIRIGRTLRFRSSDVEAWLDSKAEAGTQVNGDGASGGTSRAA